MNEVAEFAVKKLKQYAKENHTHVRTTSDISPLEEWLLIALHKAENLPISDVVGQSEQLIAKEKDSFDNGYTKGWTEGFNSGKVNGD